MWRFWQRNSPSDVASLFDISIYCICETTMKIKKLACLLAFGMTFALGLSSARADTLQDIKSRGSITIGVDFTHPPYGMLNQQSEREGTDYDIATLIARDLGVKLTVLPVTGPNRVPFLLTNKADIVIASFSVTDERKKVIAFTRPYASEPILLLAPGKDSLKGPADLNGKSIAVARGTTADIDLTNLIKDKGLTDVDVHRYLDEATTRTAVGAGQQNIMASSLADALSVKQSNPSMHFEFQFQMSDDPLAIGLRQNDAALQAWLDNWIGTNLKNGKLNAIWIKYFGIPLPKSLMS
jgi:polar amino acid transport system substrate-binding protein